MTMSATDGAASMILFHCQEPEIVLNSTTGCDPCDALEDIAAGWLWSEEVGGIVGYAVVGAVAECPVNGRIPGGSALRISGSFTEGVGDPLGWLVGDRREPVAVPVTDFALQP